MSSTVLTKTENCDKIEMKTTERGVKMKILVSACLLGEPCRYDGKSKPCEAVLQLAKEHTLFPVCPEVLGGLPTPRIPSERQSDGRVKNAAGEDVTVAYQRGAQESLRIAQAEGIKLAILKERSPSCGCSKIYDGSFSKRLTDGKGTTAELLQKHGVRVIGESELEKLDSLNGSEDTK